MNFPQLNLPPFEYKLQKAEGKTYIFDPVRKKYVMLQPEEWVRQHFIALLLANGYPKGLMRTESGFEQHQKQKRTDVLVYDREAAPYLLLECKAPDIKLKGGAIEQILTYNLSLKAPHLIISNGLRHLIFSKEGKEYQQQSELPIAPVL